VTLAREVEMPAAALAALELHRGAGAGPHPGTSHPARGADPFDSLRGFRV
jgi:hypothetical protein